MNAPHEYPEEALAILARRFRLLSEPTRLRLLCILSAEERSVGDLADQLGCTQANVSKHLGQLADEGLVSRRKAGLNTYYRVADESVFTLCDSAWIAARRHLDARAQAVRGDHEAPAAEAG
jgi:DNA-binding transcriptional ArsR family regulator